VACVDAAATVAVTLAVAAVSWPLRGPEVLVDNPSDPRVETLNAVGGVGLAVLGVLGVLSLAVLLARFRRAAPDVRRQIAWVVYGAAVAVAAGLAGLFVDAGGLFDALAACAVVGGLGMAVLRRRLYDIDVVVNRTLVYGVLTATLAGSYLAGVLLLQLVLSAVTHDSGLAVAGSTLAVAALFRPARARIQALVDRRFYRRRYDARRTLDGFATRVRDEVDLSALEADLRAVVHETLQPAHVSVWLRGPDPRP
jgi:hypothetical protein